MARDIAVSCLCNDSQTGGNTPKTASTEKGQNISHLHSLPQMADVFDDLKKALYCAVKKTGRSVIVLLQISA